VFNWEAHGRLAGTYQSSRSLSLFTLNNASHMVSVDVPDASMDMFYHAIGIKHDYFETNLKVIILFQL
jgi:hypothetical protein